jgi:outer membrane protein OmpA-like peptidoglycan-associated protein
MIGRLDSRHVTGAVLVGLALIAGCAPEQPAVAPPPPGTPPPAPPVPAGPAIATLKGSPMVIHPAGAAGFCVDDNGGGWKDGNQVFLWACHGHNNQHWTFLPAPDGGDWITGVGGKCLNVRADASDKGATELYTCSAAPSQQFKHYADGRIHDGASDKCLTATSAAKGAAIILTPCDAANPAQMWTVEAAPPPPPPNPGRVEVADDRLKLHEEIMFKTGSHEIDPVSEDLVIQIAAIIKDHPGLDFIEVAGHADKRGDNATNLTLTQQRAEEVVKQLALNGVDPTRLRGVGYSSYCPLDPADNDAAYAKNRRVELRILRRQGKDLAVKWDGCDEAKKHGLKPLPIPKTAPKTKVGPK